MKNVYYIFVLIVFNSCIDKQEYDQQKVPNQPYIVVLGNAQDAGYPQIACQKECCQRVYKNPSYKRMVSSLALVDPITNESWIFDATPDFTAQTAMLSKQLTKGKQLPDGIFLTHGHIGHYTGLMFLGREALGGNKIPVFTMPRMQEYLTENGPWSQLVTLNNITLKSMVRDSTITLNERVSVTPIQVPHRDEFTETVGFLINCNEKKALFIPDIDKWSQWNVSIVDLIKEVDVAFLDATFFKNGEIDRDMTEVPHPFVEESMKLFESLSNSDKQKVHFIHFNHTNPLFIKGSDAQQQVLDGGFRIAEQGMIVSF